MALPKRKLSKSRSAKRRTHYKLARPGLSICPNCGEIMIDRLGFEIERFDKNGKCSKCQASLNIVE